MHHIAPGIRAQAEIKAVLRKAVQMVVHAQAEPKALAFFGQMRAKISVVKEVGAEAQGDGPLLRSQCPLVVQAGKQTGGIGLKLRAEGIFLCAGEVQGAEYDKKGKQAALTYLFSSC